MRLFGRRGDEVPDVDDEDTRDEDGGTIEPSVGETVEPLAYGSGKLIEYSWNPANVLVVLAGATLAAIGIAAIAETEVNSTWYEPIESVLDINHTPLLAAIEVGVGAVMVVLGLAGASRLAAFWCLAAAVNRGHAVLGMEPQEAAPRRHVRRIGVGTVDDLHADAPPLAGVSRACIASCERGCLGRRVVERPARSIGPGNGPTPRWAERHPIVRHRPPSPGAVTLEPSDAIYVPAGGSPLRPLLTSPFQGVGAPSLARRRPHGCRMVP